jgi:TRAP-type C4-dicarboxylate transport system permease small subunit
MKNIRNILDKIILSSCVILFMFMTVVGTYQITSRYVFKSPSTVSEELLSYSFAWMAMLAASYIFGKRDHMRMSFVAEKFSQKNQALIGLLSEITVLVFSLAILLKGGASITSLTMTQTTPALQVPMGYVYAIVPLCGVMIAVYSVLNIKELITQFAAASAEDAQVKGGKVKWS